jgi:uncharacterized membrane protein
MRPSFGKVARIRSVSLSAGLGTLALSLVAGYGRPAWWSLPIVAGTVALTELLVVHVAFRRQRWTFSLTEGVIGAAVLICGGAWIVVAVAVGMLLAQLARRQPLLKLEFNVAQLSVSTAVAVAVSSEMGGGVVAACVGMAALWVVNTALVGAPLAMMTGQRLRTVWGDSISFSTLQEAGTASIGLLGGWLALHAPAGLFGLVVPVVLLWISYDEQSARAGEARLFAELASGHERASVRSVDASAAVVLTAAARLFGGADVELVLVAPDGPVRYAGDEHGVCRRHADPAAFDEPWVIGALGRGEVGVGIDEHRRPFCTAVLTGADAPIAVLLARRGAGAPGFDRREAGLAKVLIRQAESWLSVAELTVARDRARERAEAADAAARGLGDLGAVTAPALAVLRDSAARLSQVATTLDGPDPVADIVDELHAVERAVASLLGAVALAADPDLAGCLVPEIASLPAGEEWTTTGVLRPLPSEMARP